MGIKTIVLSEEQEKALEEIAKSLEKTKQEVIEEQFAFYFKTMLETHYKNLSADLPDVKLSDSQKTELILRRKKLVEDYLKEIGKIE